MKGAAIAVSAAFIAVLFVPGRAALPGNCLIGGGAPGTLSQQFDVVEGSPSSINCAKIRADSGSVLEVSLDIDGAVLDGISARGGTPTLEVVIWNLEGDYSAKAWQYDVSGVLNANTFRTAFIATPASNTGSLATNPSSVTNTVPVNFNWQSDTNTDWWAVRTSDTGQLAHVVGLFARISPCAGRYSVILNAKGNGNTPLDAPVSAGVLWRLVDATADPLAGLNVSLARPVTVTNRFVPGPRSPLSMPIADQEWADLRYMLNSAVFSVKGNANLLNVRQDKAPAKLVNLVVGAMGADTSFFGDPNVRNVSVTVDNNGGTLQFKWERGAFMYRPSTTTVVDVPIAMQIQAQSNVHFLAGSRYEFKNFGPFADLTLNIEKAMPFPELTAANPTMTVQLNTGSNLEANQQVIMVKLRDPLVYELGLEAENVRGDNVNQGGRTDKLSPSSILFRSLYARPTQRQDITDNSFPSSSPFVVNHMTSFYTSSTRVGRGSVSVASLPVQWAGKSGLSRPYVYFFRAKNGASCDGAFPYPVVSATVRLVNATAMGECASHYDCTAPQGQHPSSAADRVRFSANGDASRFSSCYLVPNVTGYGYYSRPVTKCFECAPGVVSSTTFGNAESYSCRENQFCYTDDGLCQDGGKLFVCDKESNDWVGTCRNKSWAVLGQRCRSVDGGRVTAANPNPAPGTGSATSTPDSLGMVMDGPFSEQGYAPGAGFCGEARTYNLSAASLVHPTTANPQFNLNGTVRKILWEGYCSNGICHECDTSQTPFAGGSLPSGKVCTNGRLLMPAFVDSTVRTLTINSAASATVALCFFILILIMITLVSMQNDANRHRELFGETHLSLLQVAWAVLVEWMPCCKSESPRARLAVFRTMASGRPGEGDYGATAVGPKITRDSITGAGVSSAVKNPLEGATASSFS